MNPNVVIPATGKHVWATEWTKDENGHYYACTTNGCTAKNSEAAHTAGEVVTDTPATCHTAGVGHKDCTVCGYTVEKNVAIPATNEHVWADTLTQGETTHYYACTTDGCTAKKDETAHVAGELVVDTAATCMAPGVGHKDCVCGKRVESDIAIPVDANAHTGNNHIENAKDATCGEAGYTGDTVCTSCGATVQKGEEISQEEHTYVSVVTPPTYAATGFTTHTCSGCGHKYITDHPEALTPDVDLDVNVETPDVGELKEMLKQVTKDTADAFIATAKKVIDETPELREAVQPLIEAAKAIKNEVRDMIPDDLSSYDPRDLVGSLADLFF
jgi:hypothetical protein